MKNSLIFLFLIIFLISCEDSGTDEGSFEFEEHTLKVFDPGAKKLLDLQNTNGSIDIIGTDTATMISCEITKRVKSYRSSLNAIDHINDIRIFFEEPDDRIKITVDHPNTEDLDYEIDFIITTPIIFDFTTILGNGNITVNSVSRNLSATLGNGNILTDVILLNNCAVQAKCGNGNIHMIIPDITGATVYASVGNGSITATGLPLEDQVSTGNLLSGTLGDGNGNIQVLLGNGTITLEGY